MAITFLGRSAPTLSAPAIGLVPVGDPVGAKVALPSISRECNGDVSRLSWKWRKRSYR